MATLIQIRRDTAANWTTVDPVLAQGEPALETDTLKEKIGDGVLAWTSLEYINQGIQGSIDTHLADVANPHVVTAAQAGALPVIQSSYNQIADAAPGTATTYTFDMALGDMQQVTAPAAGTFTLAFTGFVTGAVCTVIIDAVNWGNATVTFPVGIIFDSKAAPEFTAAGMDRLMIVKDKDEVYSLFVIGVDVGTV